MRGSCLDSVFHAIALALDAHGVSVVQQTVEDRRGEGGVEHGIVQADVTNSRIPLPNILCRAEMRHRHEQIVVGDVGHV